jgi:hypothetical protein
MVMMADPFADIRREIPGFIWLDFNRPVKRCAVCGIWKSLDCFSPNRDKPGGLGYRCRQCGVDLLKSRRRRAPPLDATYLRRLLDYEPQNGTFRWRVTRGPRSKVGQVAGGIDDKGYLQIGIDGWQYRGHRLAHLWMTGEWVPEIDHRDRDRANCRWTNLRASTRSQNQVNTVARPSKLGIKGVSERGGRFRAQIRFNGHRNYLGTWPTAEQAAAAYAKAAIELHGDFARVS